LPHTLNYAKYNYSLEIRKGGTKAEISKLSVKKQIVNEHRWVNNGKGEKKDYTSHKGVGIEN
jgi:hypothetical protein